MKISDYRYILDCDVRFPCTTLSAVFISNQDLLAGIWCEKVITTHLFRAHLVLANRDFFWYTRYVLCHCNSIYAQATMMPPRDFASRQDPCWGNDLPEFLLNCESRMYSDDTHLTHMQVLV